MPTYEQGAGRGTSLEYRLYRVAFNELSDAIKRGHSVSRKTPQLVDGKIIHPDLNSNGTLKRIS